MNPRHKTRLKAWGLVVSVFVLGCVTGVSVDGVLGLRSGGVESKTFRDGEAYFEKLRRDLALDAEQSTAIRNILEDARADYGVVCSEVRPRYDALRERARAGIRVLLTPEQQRRFDTMVSHEDCGTCPDRRR